MYVLIPVINIERCYLRLNASLCDERLQHAHVSMLWITKVKNFYNQHYFNYYLPNNTQHIQALCNCGNFAVKICPKIIS